MADARHKSMRSPDEVMTFPGVHQDVIELGEITIAKAVHQPGWRWSKDIKPIVGGDWCQARHVGVVLSGGMGLEFPDGARIELGPDDAFDIPPNHDGWVIGDEPLVLLEWAGVRAFAPNRGRFGSRTLASLLFTDLVDSTAMAASLGDHRWHELLAEHFRVVRANLDRFGGREIKTTGDGILAVFDGPAMALRCADAIRSSSVAAGIHIRAGVHVGEVELVGDDVRGVAVHHAARVMATAATDEIIASDTTRLLTGAAGIRFEDRGLHKLKGLEGEHRLFAYLGDES